MISYSTESDSQRPTITTAKLMIMHCDNLTSIEVTSNPIFQSTKGTFKNIVISCERR